MASAVRPSADRWRYIATVIVVLGVMLSVVAPATAQRGDEAPEADRDSSESRDRADDESRRDDPDDSRDRDQSSGGRDAEELGIVDEGLYVSPQFGHEVTWSDEWDADLESMESDPDQFFDRLSLVIDGGRFQAFFVAANGEEADQYVERLVDFRLELYPDLEVLEQDFVDDVATLTYTFKEAGLLVYDIVEVSLVDRGETLQVVELIAFPDDAEDVWEAFDGNIEVNGDYPFVVFDRLPELDDVAVTPLRRAA